MARVEDRLEHWLQVMVFAGEITCAVWTALQRDWQTAYRKYLAGDLAAALLRLRLGSDKAPRYFLTSRGPLCSV